MYYNSYISLYQKPVHVKCIVNANGRRLLKQFLTLNKSQHFYLFFLRARNDNGSKLLSNQQPSQQQVGKEHC